MPRQFFHETLASHRDTVSSCNHAQKAMGCIHQVNFNCHYDNLVVNTVYDADILYSPAPFKVPANKYYGRFLISRDSPHPGNKENKGPPVFI